jgi:exonuclease III
VVCLQEIKASPEQLPLLDFELAGPYHYWFPATKKGYSELLFYQNKNNGRKEGISDGLIGLMVTVVVSAFRDK